MATTCMKTSSVSLVIRGMRVRATVKCHLVSVRMADTKNQTATVGGRGEISTLAYCEWGCQMVRSPWETVWSFLQKLKIELPYHPTIPPRLGIYLEERLLKGYDAPARSVQRQPLDGADAENQLGAQSQAQTSMLIIFPKPGTSHLKL